jgi:fimbrial chaperone protein
VLLLVAGPAVAGVSVSPVLLTLGTKHASTAVTVTNDTKEEKVFQADPMAWRHQGEEDVYEATTQIVASPPLFRLMPGAKQVVRVGVPDGGVAATTERSYRLFLQEIPAGPRGDESGGGQLKMLLRLGLPVFHGPAAPQPENMVWQVRHNADGMLELEMHNAGNVHVRLSDLQLTLPGVAAPLKVEGFTYVFAGESRHWLLDPGKSWHGGSVKYSVQTEQGVRSVDLPLQGG